MKRIFSSGFPGIILMIGFITGLLLTLGGHAVVEKTSANDFCAACHVHPQATRSWIKSTHYDNARGIKVACVDCHLPPKGEGYLAAKVKTGTRDVWGKIFKDPESLNWEARSHPDYAIKHVYEASCIHCHSNNFPRGLSRDGREAHLYYEQKAGEIHCINCHITVGHYTAGIVHAKNLDFGSNSRLAGTLFTEAAVLKSFENFTEYIPGTNVSFEMAAITGGEFFMGSPAEEKFRHDDEGPQREVQISSFYMGMFEVSWDEYLAFFKATSSQGKTSDAYLNQETDAISGPTPPWGAPDQGWGKGRVPAITMTFHAAEVYCEWLSSVTGKTYRLPTEAEWEYAARGGSKGPYYFDGDPSDFSGRGFFRNIFGPDTGTIASNVVYLENSPGRTVRTGSTKPNPFGLSDMLGNVSEMCSDWYAPDAYARYPEGVVMDPAGPPSGEEHVIRGGSYKDAAENVRCGSRAHTESVKWLKTDPQIPKSVWWYSDCTFVGFRVVCETTNE